MVVCDEDLGDIATIETIRFFVYCAITLNDEKLNLVRQNRQPFHTSFSALTSQNAKTQKRKTQNALKQSGGVEKVDKAS